MLNHVKGKRISWVITHECDKNCVYCSQRVQTSPYRNLSEKQYYKVRDCLRLHKISHITLTGGEPLVHPGIHWLIERIREDFPRTPLTMTTNGSLLDVLSEEEIDSFASITISWYRGFNDAACEEYAKRKNFFIKDGNHWFDIDVDPDLDEAAARKFHARCPRRRIRIVGDRIYGCCNSEAIERSFGTDKIHLDIHPGWYREYRELPTYKACQHCFVTAALGQRNRRVLLARKGLHEIINSSRTLSSIFVKALCHYGRTRGAGRKLAAK